MTITSARFIKSIVDRDKTLHDGTPQVAIIGRSNAGKSSLINALTRKKNLANVSALPGRTQHVNLFLINESLYLVDLPGYGYAKASWQGLQRLQTLMFWYLFTSEYTHKYVILVIDANVGFTSNDKEMLSTLEEYNKPVIIAANKVDKIKHSEYEEKFTIIKQITGSHILIPFSSKKNIGVDELTALILS